MTPKEFIDKYGVGQEFELVPSKYGISHFQHLEGKWKFLQVMSCQYSGNCEHCPGEMLIESLDAVSNRTESACLSFTVDVNNKLKNEMPLAHIPITLHKRFLPDELFEL